MDSKQARSRRNKRQPISFRLKTYLIRRLGEFRSFLTDLPWFWLVLMVGVWLLGRSLLFPGHEIDISAGTFTEAFGIAVTIVVIERFIAKRDKTNLFEDLVDDMGGSSNEFALRAVRKLSNLGYLYDGSLECKSFGKGNLRYAKLNRAKLAGANFGEAYLEIAELDGADLRGADFVSAWLKDAYMASARLEKTNFHGAHLMGATLDESWASDAIFLQANLEKASLSVARLDGADFRGSDLRSASLWHAFLKGATFEASTLENANLEGADLEDADFSRASLKGANLKGVKNFETVTFSGTTIMPDGTAWSYDTNLQKFI